MSSNGFIWIMGAGAYSSRRLPIGLSGQLSAVDRVFTIIREPVSLWLPVELGAMDVIRLDGEFTNVESRIDNYQRIARRVVDAALAGSKVIYMTYGSPVVFDRITSLIRSMAHAGAVGCVVIPTTSSVDAVLAFVGEDMAPGLQVCEARWLVTNSVRLDPRLAALLFQVGVFSTDGLPRARDVDCAQLVGLKEYLLRSYPASHPAVFLRAPFAVGDKGYSNCRPLDAIDRGVPEDMMDTSLYLPGPERTYEEYRRFERST